MEEAGFTLLDTPTPFDTGGEPLAEDVGVPLEVGVRRAMVDGGVWFTASSKSFCILLLAFRVTNLEKKVLKARGIMIGWCKYLNNCMKMMRCYFFQLRFEH